MEASVAEASCGEPSLYAFKPRFIQSEGRVFDHVTRPFPRRLFACSAPLCIYKYVRVPAVHKSLHFISFYSRALYLSRPYWR